MSDLMLHGVLNMPLPDDPSELGVVEWVQFRERARQASDRIEALTAERDALRAQVDVAHAALHECMDEIDGYVRQEYPGDHPVHERYRNRDFSANPARIYFEARKATP